MSSAPSDPLIGRCLEERYVLEELVGYGGMSKIYKALDLRLHRSVAVKILKEDYAAEPEVRKRFAAEAVIAANLNHPNVLKVLDHNVSGQLVYLVMEFVRGQNLHKLITTRGRLTPRQTLSLLESICRGLAAAHAEEIVHRDIKPANVLISDAGTVQIADFGLARAASAHTQSSTLLATLQYASPELVSGRPADARSDIYAVGVMIYQMLTGQLPFPEASIPTLIHHHLHTEMPLPSTRIARIAEDLDELVRFCTEKEPENRPQNAAFLLAEVMQIQHTLSDEQLDLGAELYGGLADLVVHDAPHATSVQQRLGQWEASELKQEPDPWWTEQQETEATTVLNLNEHPTEAFNATEAATQAYAGRKQPMDQSPTQAYPDPHQATTPPAAQPFTPQPTMAFSPDSAQQSEPEEAPLSKREQQRAQKQWRRQAQIPTHKLAQPMSAGRRVLLTLLILLAVAVVAVAAWFFGRGPGSIISIPQLSGMLQDQAVEKLDQAGVPVRVSNVHHDDVAVGRVIASSPTQGQNIMRFQGVELSVSRGPEIFQMPQVAGLDPAAARSKLESLQLRAPKISEEYSESVPVGTVISSSPQAGEQLTRKSATALVVSAGPAPIDVPNLLSMRQAEAEAALNELGLQLAVDEEVYSSEIPAGHVAVQTPEQGTVAAGSTVRVQVSKGPEYIQIPSVMGQPVDEAVATLEDAGFAVDTRKMLGERSQTVRLQTPLNQRAERGSTITIYLF